MSEWKEFLWMDVSLKALLKKKNNGMGIENCSNFYAIKL